MILKRHLVSFLIVISLVGCKSEDKEVQSEFYNNGHMKSQTIKINKFELIKMSYYENGNLKTISRHKNGILNGEQLWFHENGYLDQKVLYNNNLRQNNAYFYYPSGMLKSTRYFRDGKPVLYGADYWDDTLNLVKTSLHFNDNGEISYKKNFNNKGHLISEEGKR